MSKRSIFLSVAGGVLGLFLVAWAYVGFGSISYSEGNRVGYIVKFSKKGYPWGFKTWEGEMSLGVGLSVNKQSGGIWEFSVADPEAMQDLEKAQLHNRQVKVHYIEQMWVQSWRGKTNYFVTAVEEIKQ